GIDPLTERRALGDEREQAVGARAVDAETDAHVRRVLGRGERLGGRPTAGERARVAQGAKVRSTPAVRSASTTTSVVSSAMRRSVVSLPPATTIILSGRRAISCS